MILLGVRAGKGARLGLLFLNIRQPFMNSVALLQVINEFAV